MKLPREVLAERLIRVLERLGYKKIRQKGSHLRMMHPEPPEHFLTIPMHNPLKMGTLHGILQVVAAARAVSPKQVLDLN